MASKSDATPAVDASDAVRSANPGEAVSVGKASGGGGVKGGGGSASQGQQPEGTSQSSTSAQDPIPEPMRVQPSVAANLAAPGGSSFGCGMMGANILSGTVVPPPDWTSTTTVMMRNLPNKYTQRLLLTEINYTGFLGTVDFLYLPIDPETNANRGYAFLNFIEAGFAWMFKMSYEGRKMNRFNSNKVVSVVPATLQGFEANYAHYAAARVSRGDPAARPLFLREPTQLLPGSGYGGIGGAEDADWQGRGAAAWPEGCGNYIGLEAAGASKGMEPPYPGEGEAASDSGEGKHSAPPAGCGVGEFCPNCGGKIQPEFQFCPHCGTSLDFSGLAGSHHDSEGEEGAPP